MILDYRPQRIPNRWLGLGDNIDCLPYRALCTLCVGI